MNPFQILQAAIKKVPALRYALAVAGIAAIIPIVASYKLEWRVAIVGWVLVFVGMVVVVVFVRLTKLGSHVLKGPAIFLIWACVILLIVFIGLLASSMSFNWPRSLSEWIKGKSLANPPHWAVTNINGQGVRLVRETARETVYEYWNLAGADQVLRHDSELRYERPNEFQEVRIGKTNLSSKIAELRGHGSDVRAIAFNPKGKIIATGGEDGYIGLWDIEHFKCLGIITGFKGIIRALAFSSDGKRLSVAGERSSVWVFDTERLGLSQRFSMTLGPSRINSVMFSSDGRFLAAAGSGPPYVWKTDDGQKVGDFEKLRRGPSYAYGVAFSGKGSAFAVGFHGGETSEVGEFVRFWRGLTVQAMDLTGSNDRTIGVSHDDVIGSVQFSPDGHLLARATRAQGSFIRGSGPGGSLIIWDLNEQFERRSYSLSFGNYYSLAFYGETNVFVVVAGGKIDRTRGDTPDFVTTNRYISVWNSLMERPLGFETDHTLGIAACAISPDCKFLATSGVDSPRVSIWRIETIMKEAVIQTDANTRRLFQLAQLHARNASRLGFNADESWKSWLKETLFWNPNIRSLSDLKAVRWSTRTPFVDFFLNSLGEEADKSENTAR